MSSFSKLLLILFFGLVGAYFYFDFQNGKAEIVVTPTITAEKVLAEACKLWADEANVGKDVPISETIFMSVNAAAKFSEAAALDSKYSELGKEAWLLVSANNKGVSSDVRAQYLIAGSDIASKCTK